MKRKTGATAIWIMTFIYAHLSTRYFGHHWNPASDAEVICDGLTVLMMALGIVLWCHGGITTKQD